MISYKEVIKDKNTQWLKNELKKVDDAEDLIDLINSNKEVITHDTAAGYYLKCLVNHELTTKYLYKIISEIKISCQKGVFDLINRTYLVHFLNGRKELSRDNLFIISILGKLTLVEVSNLLKYANVRDFYVKDERDVIIQSVFSSRDKNKKPELQNPLKMYKMAEMALKKRNMLPLCNKIELDNTPPETDLREYIPSSEKSTIFIKEKIAAAKTDEELYRIIDENPLMISSEDESKYKRVAAYLLECAKRNWGTPSQFIKHLTQMCPMQVFSFYHLFNINNKSSIKKGFTRNNIITIGLIGEFELEQVDRALNLNNSQPLYVKNLRDLWLAFFIQKHCSYGYAEQELLRQGFEPLNKKAVDYYYGMDVKDSILEDSEIEKAILTEIELLPLPKFLKFESLKIGYEALTSNKNIPEDVVKKNLMGDKSIIVDLLEEIEYAPVDVLLKLESFKKYYVKEIPKVKLLAQNSILQILEEYFGASADEICYFTLEELLECPAFKEKYEKELTKKLIVESVKNSV